MVVIETRFSPDLRAACLNKTVQVEPHSQLLAVKHCFHSGKLMDTRGEPIDGPSEVDSEGFMFSTCKITMVCCLLPPYFFNHYALSFDASNLLISYVHTSSLC